MTAYKHQLHNDAFKLYKQGKMAFVKARVQDDDVKAQGNETCTGFVVVVLK